MLATKRKEGDYTESNDGSISYEGNCYVLVGRQGVDEHLLAAGDVLELPIGGRRQTVCVASGGYRGWYYITIDGQRARFALCMKARLASQ